MSARSQHIHIDVRHDGQQQAPGAIAGSTGAHACMHTRIHAPGKLCMHVHAAWQRERQSEDECRVMLEHHNHKASPPARLRTNARSQSMPMQQFC